MEHAVTSPLLLSANGQRQLSEIYRAGLLEDTLPFWFPRAIDGQYGGFLHCLDRDGSLLDTDKSVWAQGRMSWMLLTLYNTVERRAEWLEWGTSGLTFLERHCCAADGRMYFHVQRDGAPIRKRRYAYSESFAAIAYAAHYQATGEERSARRAGELFDAFTRWNFTPGLMPPKFEPTRPAIGLGPRMITIATAQELRRCLGGSEELTAWIDRCVGEIRDLFVKPAERAVMESVAPNGEIIDHFDGRLLNPGHAIEAAWFLLQEGQCRQDAALLELGCQMLDWMWTRGWDEQYGGLFYFRDLRDKPVQEYWHDMKFWWPHDEAIIATLLAYLVTGQTKYAHWHQAVHDWSYQHFADPEHGEWFGYLHRDGSRSSTGKGNLWKSFFHHPRMQWMCWQLLKEAA